MKTWLITVIAPIAMCDTIEDVNADYEISTGIKIN